MLINITSQEFDKQLCRLNFASQKLMALLKAYVCGSIYSALITTSLHIMTGGYVFTGVCLFRWGVPYLHPIISPSYNTSTGPMSFLGVPHNTSTSSMSFPGHTPVSGSRSLPSGVPQSQMGGYPSPRWGGTPVPD